MHLVWDAYDVLRRDPATYDQWQPAEQELYRVYLEQIAGEEDGD